MPPPRSIAATRTRLDRVDLALGLLLGLVATLLYRATWQEYLWDDGPRMAAHVSADLGPWYHLALVPAAELVQRWTGAPGGVLPLLILSTFGAVVAVVATFWYLRAMGAGRRIAGIATVLVGLSTPLWFLGTTTEIHTLHAGAVVFVALLFCALPWGRRGPAFAASVAIAAVLLAATVLVHRSALVTGGGSLALARLLSERRGAHRPAWLWLFVVGPLWLATGLVVGHFGGLLFGDVSLQHDNTHAIGIFTAFHALGHPIPQLWEDWVASWPAVFVLAVVGAVVCWRDGSREDGPIRTATTRARRPVLWVALAGILPAVALFAALGIRSSGGYAAATLPFLLLLVVEALEFARRRLSETGLAVLASVAIVASAAGAWHESHDPIRLRDGRIGVERARETSALLPDGGYVLSADPTTQLIDARVPNVTEYNVSVVLPRRRGPGTSFPTSIPMLDALVAENSGRVLWDPNWRELVPVDSPQRKLNILPLEAYFERMFTIERRSAGRREYWQLSWPLER